MSYTPEPRWVPPTRRVPASTSPLVPIATLVVVLGLLVGGLFLYRAYDRWAGSGRDPDAVPREVTPRGDLSELEKTNINLYKKSRPSVVHITTLTNRSDGLYMNVQQVPEGTGSGFVWDDKGHIVTNY